MLDALKPFLPFLGTLAGVCAVLFGLHWVLIKRRGDLGNEKLFSRQLTMLAFTLLGVIVIVVALPIDVELRNKLLGLIGIIASGVIAFSSTSIVANLMAGLLLRITKPFRVGDFIRVGDHFGRVSERGLFETEIQSETRELIALPNTYCINNPVTTIRASGTIISSTLTLGYDVTHSRVSNALQKAARNAGLEDPFVHILELGNYSVSYRVSGFLSETKRVLSARSNLNACVLDALHGDGIEIVSPTFMNQRRLDEHAKVIPQSDTSRAAPPRAKPTEKTAEDIAFDKAERAEAHERQKSDLQAEIETLEESLKKLEDEEARKEAQDDLEKKRAQLKEMSESKEEDPDEAPRPTPPAA